MTFHVIGPIKYGYPTAQKVEPNVKLQYLFDEASSTNIVDEVGGQVLTVTGSPTSVSAPGHFNHISPGLQYNGTDSHDNLGGMTGLTCAVGQHIVLEFWLQPPDTTSALVPLFFGGVGTVYFYVGFTPGVEVAVITSSDSDFPASSIFTLPMWTLAPHHFRIKLVRGANMEVFMDGVSLTRTYSEVFPAGETYTFTNLTVADSHGLILYEARLSIGSDVANNHSYPAYNFHVQLP